MSVIATVLMLALCWPRDCMVVPGSICDEESGLISGGPELEEARLVRGRRVDPAFAFWVKRLERAAPPGYGASRAPSSQVCP